VLTGKRILWYTANAEKQNIMCGLGAVRVETQLFEKLRRRLNRPLDIEALKTESIPEVNA
jgi:hypothetical protein